MLHEIFCQQTRISESSFFLCLMVWCIWKNHIPVSSISPQTTLVLETFIKELLAHICQILATLLFLLLHTVHKPILEFRSTLLKILVDRPFRASGLAV